MPFLVESANVVEETKRLPNSRSIRGVQESTEELHVAKSYTGGARRNTRESVKIVGVCVSR